MSLLHTISPAAAEMLDRLRESADDAKGANQPRLAWTGIDAAPACSACTLSHACACEGSA